MLTPKLVTSFAGPISASLHAGNSAPFEEILQRLQAVGNAASDLTCTSPRFEPLTSHSREERLLNYISVVRIKQYLNCAVLFVVAILQILPGEMSQHRDEKGHGDKTVDGSLIVQNCTSTPADLSISCQEKSLPDEAGDQKPILKSTECDYGYFSLPRRSGSCVFNSPLYPICMLPTSNHSNESFNYHSCPSTFSEKSAYSKTPSNETYVFNSKTVGCQTDLMLFAVAKNEFNKVLILRQEKTKAPTVKNNHILSFFRNVASHTMIFAALWNYSQGHIIDLEKIIRKFVLPLRNGSPKFILLPYLSLCLFCVVVQINS